MKPEDDVELFTWIKRDGTDKFKVHQEVNKTKVPGSEGSYKASECPWIPLRLVRIDGEDYGRSYVEEYFGDLRSLEGLSQAIVEGSAAAAKVLLDQAGRHGQVQGPSGGQQDQSSGFRGFLQGLGVSMDTPEARQD